VDKINIPSQAKEEFVILKHSVKGRIRMELRIREIDKGGAARVTNTREAGPFPSASSGAWFHCTVIEFIELAVIRCSGTRFESDESGPFGKLRGLVFLVRSMSLSNWPLLVAYGPDLKVTKVWPFGKLKGLVSLYGQ
jgi:hypothetical protein